MTEWSLKQYPALARRPGRPEIRPARVDNITKIINLTDEAKAWLRYKGTDQWSMDWPDQKARGHRVLRGMADTYRSAREGYDLFHELAHSELPVGQRSYVTKGCT